MSSICHWTICSHKHAIIIRHAAKPTAVAGMSHDALRPSGHAGTSLRLLTEPLIVGPYVLPTSVSTQLPHNLTHVFMQRGLPKAWGHLRSSCASIPRCCWALLLT